MVTLTKIDLPGKHIFNGNEFPVAYEISGDSNNNDKIEKFLQEKAKTGFFIEQLDKHGAIVIRNSNNKNLNPEIISKFIKAISNNSGLEFFIQNGSTAKRREVTEILSTANEGPHDKPIYQHNEFSRFIKYPTTLFFVCDKINAKGGETPVVHGGELFEAINKEIPEFNKELSKRGLFMEQIWTLKSDNNTHWSYKFCFGRNIDPNDKDFENNKKIAIKLAKEIASPFCEFNKDNDLRISQYTNPIRIYESKNGISYPCFFNSIATFYANVKLKIGGYSKTKNISYNDGGEIPQEYLDLTLQKSIDLAYNHAWQQGDIVILNNYQVSHGRCPWEGERKILVSMWDEIDKADYKPWLV
ncbi:hypothetical protein C6P40_005314 [Pichia californica]|uniref:TauD/TfdA-like domain-containing protein n=1 Tax=Pichia californica TaxID=460514 RepID=A0A9P6WR72_9ASCO|nr:hypothetical protein C6P42_000074 [[Candida] californica]KAG0691087.1 hypothetical protein C6P40_005314 [[Candida] californica]